MTRFDEGFILTDSQWLSVNVSSPLAQNVEIIYYLHNFKISNRFISNIAQPFDQFHYEINSSITSFI